MVITKGVQLDYSAGKLALTADLGGLLIPILEDLKAKVESGAIDPIKGTDLDKVAIEQVIALAEKYLAVA